MKSGEKKRTWTYDERRSKDDSTYVLRAGGKVIGEVKSPGDADLICRARSEVSRQAMQYACEIRQNRLKTSAFKEDIRILMKTLDHVSETLKRASRPREVTAARELAQRVLRAMKSRGYNI